MAATHAGMQNTYPYAEEGMVESISPMDVQNNEQSDTEQVRYIIILKTH